MNNDILFEITNKQLETGLRGIPVGYCATSNVDPHKGLYYMGSAVSEMADWEPEQVIYLLFYGKEGSKEAVFAFSKELKKRSQCQKKTIEHIRNLPREGHPMKIFSAALLITGMLEGTNNYKEDALNLIAKVPEIAATVINHHRNIEQPTSQPEKGYMENFVHLLNIPEKDRASFTKVIKLFDILHLDHGGGNLSTFTGKTVASGLEDLYGAATASMCSLAGPLHGKANQDCLQFVQKILDSLGENVTEQQLEEYVQNCLNNKELIFGFGHAVLRVEDPRASIQYAVAESLYPNHPLIKIALLLRSAVPNVLKKNPKISNPYPNVDAISGSLLTAAGFPFPSYYTVLFGMSRLVGISRQIIYERCEARGGKGVAITRPKYFFQKLT